MDLNISCIDKNTILSSDILHFLRYKYFYFTYFQERDLDTQRPGIDEMPKSQIEKRKRNMESTSRVSRREKRNVEICFLVREENENFCKKMEKF